MPASSVGYPYVVILILAGSYWAKEGRYRANGGHSPYFGKIATLEILTAGSAAIWFFLPLK
ncbi:hypothetical protein [Paenibacillus mesotrionivorans]|uniref:Uncharacterized protein n=1 Tax=Paenibacillus mesotrionivorans TaxID=3160968 RepID=A0ACC7NTL6_9BACL